MRELEEEKNYNFNQNAFECANQHPNGEESELSEVWRFAMFSNARVQRTEKLAKPLGALLIKR